MPGKTLHMATLMKNKGLIVSLDKVKSKVHQIKRSCNAHGISNVKTFALDSTKLLELKDLHGLGQVEEENFGELFQVESFDKILLDPPCSGLGQRPRMQEKMSYVDVRSAAKYQQKLLGVAYQLLKPGGKKRINSQMALTYIRNFGVFNVHNQP
jgi:16S rRNA C967 or C1407 C5-methylase (RsmB/RsmF family)